MSVPSTHSRHLRRSSELFMAIGSVLAVTAACITHTFIESYERSVVRVVLLSGVALTAYMRYIRALEIDNGPLSDLAPLEVSFALALIIGAWLVTDATIDRTLDPRVDHAVTYVSATAALVAAMWPGVEWIQRAASIIVVASLAWPTYASTSLVSALGRTVGAWTLHFCVLWWRVDYRNVAGDERTLMRETTLLVEHHVALVAWILNAYAPALIFVALLVAGVDYKQRHWCRSLETGADGARAPTAGASARRHD